MKHSLEVTSLPGILLVVFFCLLQTNCFSHEATNLDDFALDQTNQKILTSILNTQEILSDFFQFNKKTDVWPSQSMIEVRNELIHLQEDSEMNLEYLAINGININQPEALKKNPLAGRTVSASQAINTTIALLDRAISLDNQEEFIKEIHSSGPVAHMFNLVTIIKEKMDLYGELMKCTLNSSHSTSPYEQVEY